MATPAPNTHASAPVAKQAKRVVVALAVNFELNTTTGLRRVIFGLAKNTTGTDIQWQIHFTLFERAKRTDPLAIQ